MRLRLVHVPGDDAGTRDWMSLIRLTRGTDMNDSMPKLSAVAIALAAAGLAGCASSGSNDAGSTMSAAKASTTDLVHCYDVNVCKGHNDCKTASNSCAGHASCKGTGFVATPEKACADIGGSKGA